MSSFSAVQSGTEIPRTNRFVLRWRMIGLVTLGTILNYLARSTLSVAAPQLKTEFGMSTEDYSWVVLAFQASYTVMQTVAGSVLDLLGTRLGFFLFAVGWALANMAHALATLQSQTGGRWLLTATGLGFVAFGIYSFVEARWRRISNGRWSAASSAAPIG